MENLQKACSIFLLLFITGATFSQNSSKRIALVIGAQNYTKLPPLHNSLSDARAMTAVLQGKGFQVETVYDPKTKPEIKSAINRYFNQMRDQVGATGIIFYAGHGMQYNGENYIIPTTATLQNPGDLEDCLTMNTVMRVLNESTKSLNILLMDACRSLPSFTRGTEQGLTKMDAPEGAIIVFATQPGKVASDGTGTNGLFTSKLLKVINEPDLNITDVFRRVKQEVLTESGGAQLPSVEDNSTGGDFYFSGNGKAPASIPTYSAPAKQETAVSQTNSEPAPTPFEYGYGFGDAPTVTVGPQQWLGKNLNVDHFANGDKIPEVQSDDEWKRAAEEKRPAWCYYKNDRANGRTYGKLYNWYAVRDPRGLAPKGWHVPSYQDWTSLISYLGKSDAGAKMKTVTLWQANGNGDNSSGLAFPPGGSRVQDGRFGSGGGVWWSSSEFTPEEAWFFLLHFSNSLLGSGPIEMGFGYSVRCIRD